MKLITKKLKKKFPELRAAENKKAKDEELDKEIEKYERLGDRIRKWVASFKKMEKDMEKLDALLSDEERH